MAPSIPTQQEPSFWQVAFSCEACCFCHQDTCHWTALPERMSGEQVACCLECSEIFEPEVVPTKSEWFEWHRSQIAGGGT